MVGTCRAGVKTPGTLASLQRGPPPGPPGGPRGACAGAPRTRCGAARSVG